MALTIIYDGSEFLAKGKGDPMWPNRNDAYRESYNSRLLLGSFAFSPSAPVSYLHNASARLGLSSYGMPRNINSVNNTANTLYLIERDNTGYGIAPDVVNRSTKQQEISVEPESGFFLCCFRTKRNAPVSLPPSVAYQRLKEPIPPEAAKDSQRKVRY